MKKVPSFSTKAGPSIFSKEAKKYNIQERISKGTRILADAYKGFRNPSAYSIDEGLDLFFVLASSPRNDHWRWDLKTDQKFLYMKSWSWEEILQARSMQAPLPDENLLRKQFDFGGPSARIVYQAKNQEALERYRRRVNEAISRLNFGDLKAVLEEPSNAHNAKVYSTLLLVLPKSDTNREEADIMFTGRMIFDKLMAACRGKEVEKLEDLFGSAILRRGPYTAVGMIFEQPVHNLGRLGGGPFPLSEMMGRDNEENRSYMVSPETRNTTYYTFDPRRVERFRRLSDVITDSNLSTKFYYQPMRRNQLAFDSSTVSNDGSGLLITFYKISIS